MTPIYRSCHTTASSTTGSWSRWDILTVLFISILTLMPHFFDFVDSYYFYKVSLSFLFFRCTFPLFLQVHFAYALCV